MPHLTYTIFPLLCICKLKVNGEIWMLVLNFLTPPFSALRFPNTRQPGGRQQVWQERSSTRSQELHSTLTNLLDSPYRWKYKHTLTCYFFVHPLQSTPPGVRPGLTHYNLRNRRGAVPAQENPVVDSESAHDFGRVVKHLASIAMRNSIKARVTLARREDSGPKFFSSDENWVSCVKSIVYLFMLSISINNFVDWPI